MISLISEVVGTDVGADVGAIVGAEVGADVGAVVGADVGADVGALVGADVGTDVGAVVSAAVDADVDAVVGAAVALMLAQLSALIDVLLDARGGMSTGTWQPHALQPSECLVLASVLSSVRRSSDCSSVRRSEWPSAALASKNQRWRQ